MGIGQRETTNSSKGGDQMEWEQKPRVWKFILLAFLIALVLRMLLIVYPEVIHNDGTEYIRHAKQFASGEWSGGKSPPLYPSLIALAHFFTQDYERAGILVSVVFGALLVLPVFYLGKEIFGEKVGFIAALFATVHPILYTSSGSVLTESTYYFFLATSVLFGWYAFSKGGLCRPLLFALFTTLAYLTRPEAVGFLIIFSVWTLVVNPPDGERRFFKRAGIISVALISFVAFSFPYLLQIRHDTGRWALSKKTKVLLGSFSEEEEAPSLQYLRKRRGITLSSIVKHPLPVLGKTSVGLLNSLYRFQQAYHPLLFILVVVGWVFLFRKKGVSRKANLFLTAFLIFYFAFVFPFFFISRRYSSQMISISLPWAAFGLLELGEWVKARYLKKERRKHFLTAVLVLLLIGFFVQARGSHRREERYILREAGLWMKDSLVKGSKVMSRMPQVPFYAKMAWLIMPEGASMAILGEARRKEATYLVVEEDIGENSPGGWDTVKREDLVPVKEFKKMKQRIIIFEVVYPQ
jgi:4-amino-4-deoxy-L-arabinose transferase-like glycosyltransferase